MAGLANSRHAPHPHRPTRHDHPPASATFTVTPAATDGAAETDTDTHTNTHTAAAPRSHSTPAPASSTTTSTTSTTTTTAATNNPPTTLTAPRPPPAPAPAAAPSAAHELARYAKIIRRLQWKLPFLAQGYRLAVDRVGADPAAVSEAELMFKLDFFEYYMLIERALVHLLGVFGVAVPRGGGGGGGGAAAAQQQQQFEGGGGENRNKMGLAGSVWREGRHRYHANVLAALDREGNPLRGTLGAGDVRAQLGRAKDLRNRWKTAGEEDEETGHGDRASGNRSPTKSGGGGASPERKWRTRKVAAPLDSYRLEHMLEVIFAGFDEAFKIAEASVRGSMSWADEVDMEMLEAADGAAADDEDQWEFMVEAMDWEAV